ncbi:MAG: thiamine-phosphate kinase [Candidatus Amoebophilus sp. 36-38]|nr:MAG: thiamine-phosphate kinase [Candidatus Amoebophilus sp. 36-38]
MSTSKTELKDLGKFKLIDLLTENFKTKKKSSTYGIGDDAAVIDAGIYYTLVTTDMFVEGVHFDLTYAPLKHVGYKSVVANIADITAMNGTIEQITVSIAISNRFTLEALQELYQGIYTACERYEIDLVGGDTTSSPAGLVISITAIGKVAKEKLCLRSGAKPYDLVCVTGDLGAAYIGLQVLNREKKLFEVDPNMQPQLVPYQYLIERQLKPEARADIIQLFEKLKLLPTSMIDISDGLASELLHLSKASNVGFTIHEDKLPIDRLTYETTEALHLSPTLCALHGGEDYELLFTISQADLPKIEGNPNIHLIGYITEPTQGLKLVTNSGESVNVTAQGWEPL